MNEHGESTFSANEMLDRMIRDFREGRKSCNTGVECASLGNKERTVDSMGNGYDDSVLAISEEEIERICSNTFTDDHSEPTQEQIETDISKFLGEQIITDAIDNQGDKSINHNNSSTGTVSNGFDDAVLDLSEEEVDRICLNSPVEDSSEPTPEQMKQDLAKLLGGQFVIDTNNKPLQKSASIIKTTKENASAYQCAVTIFRCHEFCFLDSPETSSTISRFDGRIWTPVTPNWLRCTIMETLDEDEKSSIRGFKAYIKNVHEFLLAITTKEGRCFSDEDFSRVKNHAVFLNCVYDVATGTMLKHSSDLPYERLINVNYDEENTDTPVYRQIISFATAEDPDSMAMFDYFIGYLAIPNQTGKCLFYLGTAPDSGKSILSDSICKCFSDRTYKVDPENLNGRFSYANAAKAHLYCCSDMRDSELSATVASQFKRITGDRVIRVESKFKNEEQVTVRFKIMLVSNFPLLVKCHGYDEAFYRRVIVLPFIQSVSPEQRDSSLEAKLDLEMSAVFSKAVRRLKEIIDINGGIIFPQSELSTHMKENWCSTTDMVDTFLEQTVQLSDSSVKKKTYISTDELHQRYLEFIGNSGCIAIECDFDHFKKRVISFFSKTSSRISLGRGRPDGYINPVSCFVNLEYKTTNK